MPVRATLFAFMLALMKVDTRRWKGIDKEDRTDISRIRSNYLLLVLGTPELLMETAAAVAATLDRSHEYLDVLM